MDQVKTFLKVAISIVGGAAVLCILAAIVFAAWGLVVPNAATAGLVALFIVAAIVFGIIGAAGFWRWLRSR